MNFKKHPKYEKKLQKSYYAALEVYFKQKKMNFSMISESKN
jgi:hypothetical protein